jgi:hypothetical protein
MVQRDHLVHRFFRGRAASLGLFDLVWVAALLGDEIENVEHLELVLLWKGRRAVLVRV